MKLDLQRVGASALMLSGLVLAACTTVSGKPTVVIASPPSSSQYKEGDDVAIQSISADSSGIVRVELDVDGAVVRNDTPPSPQTSFSLIQTWKATPGNHTIAVRAYNAAAAVSDPAAILISVSASGGAPAGAPTATATTTTTQPQASNSPTPTPSGSGSVGCTNNAAFVADVSIPDGTVLAAGQTFAKTWRLANNGTCAWGAGYQLVFVSGEAMTTSSSVSVAATNPGSNADIAVAMAAPTGAGTHTGTWRMRSPAGAIFGQSVTVKIVVPGAPPPPPPPSCSGTPNIASFTAASPTITAGASTTLNWGPVTGAESVEIDHDIGGVPTPGSTSISPSTTTTYTMTAHCGSNTKTAQVTVTVNAPPPFQVTGTSASTTSTSCGKFDATTKFDGNITVNAAGTVKYKWENSNAPSGGTILTLVFNSAGTLSVQQNSLTSSETGQMYIHVTSPNDKTSNKITFPQCP